MNQFRSALRPLTSFALGAAFSLTTALLLQAAEAGGKSLYGVIEIGATGVGATAVKAPEGRGTGKTLEQIQPAPGKTYEGEIAKNVDQAVTTLKAKLTEELKVPADHLFLVASSNLPAETRQALGHHKIGGLQPEFLEADHEATLTFQGIVPTERYKLNEVVLLQIGNGETDGVYLKSLRPQVFTTFSIPWGEANLSKVVNEKKKDGSMAVAAEPLRQELLVGPTQSVVRDFPGTVTSKRLYLTGGIAWAMATLLHPEQVASESPWVDISHADLEKFCDLALNDPATLLSPDLSAIAKESRAKAEEEVARVGKAYNQDQLIAGAMLLKTFLEEMKYQDKDKIAFAKHAQSAWPVAYVAEAMADQKGTHASVIK